MQHETVCPECGGLGWRGDLRGEAFARTAEIAYAGRLPKRDCVLCKGTGRAPDQKEEDHAAEA